MGTSRSPDESIWRATAAVYSGRRDPAWELTDDVAELLEIWELLPPSPEIPPEPPPLGYRGCRLTAPDGRVWNAFGGIITLEAGASAESRRDDGRFERALLATAPPGSLPHGLPDI